MAWACSCAFRNIRLREITDGLSTTLMAGETIPTQCDYNCGVLHRRPLLSATTVPINIFLDDTETIYGIYSWDVACHFKSFHPGGACFVFGDGNVQFLADTIDFQLYNNLGTRAGGETVSPP